PVRRPVASSPARTLWSTSSPASLAQRGRLRHSATGWLPKDSPDWERWPTRAARTSRAARRPSHMLLGPTFNDLQLRQHPLASYRPQRFDVAPRDFEQPGRIARDRRDALLAQQVQHRVRRSVRVIFHRAGAGARELVARVEAGELDVAPLPELLDKPLRGAQKIVVGAKCPEDVRVDQQRRFDGRDRRCDEDPDLAGQIVEQPALVPGVANDVTDLVRREDAPGEGTEVEPDHH